MVDGRNDLLTVWLYKGVLIRFWKLKDWLINNGKTHGLNSKFFLNQYDINIFNIIGKKFTRNSQ